MRMWNISVICLAW